MKTSKKNNEYQNNIKTNEYLHYRSHDHSPHISSSSHHSKHFPLYTKQDKGVFCFLWLVFFWAIQIPITKQLNDKLRPRQQKYCSIQYNCDDNFFGFGLNVLALIQGLNKERRKMKTVMSKEKPEQRVSFFLLTSLDKRLN